ncbi:MAG: DNA-primase RepB domain-containing protein [Campylobacterota bacterium]|nr:DNA-primase RepB domain-containing protein [Campylobacterota bacterium]
MRAIEFLKDYFNEDEYFIIAQKYPKIDDKVKHHHSMLNITNKNIDKQLGKFYYLNKDKNVDIYFSLNTYKQQKSFYPSRREQYVNSIKSFYFDIDKGDIEEKKQNIIKMFGTPTYIIESSKNKFQFIYKFDKPLIINSIEDIKYFKQLLKSLTYHFDIDKTFDSARIFRLVGYMNKKQANNNFKVKIEKNNYYYTFEEFEIIAKNYLLQKPTTTLSNKKKLDKPIKTKPKTYSDIEYKKYSAITKKFNRRYKEFSQKYNNDKSTADIAYARWLYFQKNLSDEKIIIKIFEARGYKDLIEKHAYQIDYYFDNILEKCKL